MHEILILYILLKGQSTMYGISKSISQQFGYITNPSFGTIQPALKRLEKNEYIKSDRFYTEGGKPYYFYSITEKGKTFFREKLVSNLSRNPIQLYPEILIRLTCFDILNSDDRKILCKILKSHVLKLQNCAENIMASDEYKENSSGRMVLNGVVCSYKSLYDLIERLEKNAGNS